MLDTTDAMIALWNRAKTLTAMTTGSIALGATTTGYTRASGSFIADKFEPGMEITPSGFGANTVGVIEKVTATQITTKASRAAEASASGRSLRVTVPALRRFENMKLRDSVTGLEYDVDPPGRPYIEELFTSGTHEVPGFPANGSEGEEEFFYALTWYGLEGYGSGSIRRPTDALKQLFAPGTVLSVGGATLRVPLRLGPVAGEVIPQLNGWAARQVRIPLVSRSINTVAA